MEGLLGRHRMPGNSISLVLVNILAALSVSSGQPCAPRYPARIPAPGGDDPSQGPGIWYGYRQNGDVTVNQMIIVNGFGPTIDPSTGATAHQQYFQMTYSTSSQSPACQNQFTVQTYSVDGLMIGNHADSKDNYTVIRFALFDVLYHDYANLIVAYGCGSVGKADGTCDSPIIWAQTRVRSNQLSVEQMANFDGIINRVFKDYCVTTDLLPKQIHDSNQAQCPNLDPPACFGSLIKGLHDASTAGQTTSPPVSYSADSSATTAASGSKCRWPVTLQPAVNYDPASLAGLWYVYRQLWSPEPFSANMRVIWHNLGKGYVPLTNWTGNYMWAESALYDTPDSTKCSFGYYTGFRGSTGGNLGFRFVSTDGQQIPLRDTTLYADDQLQFYYSCITPNLQTRICDSPYGFFAARTDTSKWSATEKSRADNIIDRLLQDYGCSAKDIRLMTHLEKPMCSFEGGTTCVRQYIAGFSELAQPVIGGY